jgi:ribosomal-protein-alanine N-acetyltransferase
MYMRLMRRQDIPQVSQIDQEAFPTDWPPTNFTREMENHLALYIIACSENPAPSVDTDLKSPPPRDTHHLLYRIKNWLMPGDSHHHSSPVENRELIIGYAGMWIMADEAHVTSIASGQKNLRQGIGEALLLALTELAIQRKVRILTLEVRVSNIAAQNLYTKYGFQKMGIRKGYYLNNREDAIIMSTEYIGSSAFQEHMKQLKEAHAKKWGQIRFEFATQNMNPG